jgi:hypothetical protein
MLLFLLLSICFSTAHAEENFEIDIAPELQERFVITETRIQAPVSNFGYRTVRLTIQPKQSGDKPVIWAKFYDADNSLLESIWDRVKTDGKQKCKFDYMDVQQNAVRMELSIGNQQ